MRFLFFSGINGSQAEDLSKKSVARTSEGKLPESVKRVRGKDVICIEDD